jgi:hypothetical protein
LTIFDAPLALRNFVFGIRVARWYIFKPKIPIGVNFEGPWNGKVWYILWPFEIYYSHLGNLAAIWCMFPRFVILCQSKIWQPCLESLR